MTPEQATKVDLWRAYFLGVRTAIIARGGEISNDAVHSILEKLDAITRGDETLYDAASEPVGHNSQGEDHVFRVQTAMRLDRELAKEITEGFHYLAQETKR
jgi:hypothetical protein